MIDVLDLVGRPLRIENFKVRPSAAQRVVHPVLRRIAGCRRDASVPYAG